jgi:hypothetical protein
MSLLNAFVIFLIFVHTSADWIVDYSKCYIEPWHATQCLAVDPEMHSLLKSLAYKYQLQLDSEEFRTKLSTITETALYPEEERTPRMEYVCFTGYYRDQLILEVAEMRLYHEVFNEMDATLLEFADVHSHREISLSAKVFCWIAYFVLLLGAIIKSTPLGVSVLATLYVCGFHLMGYPMLYKAYEGAVGI